MKQRTDTILTYIYRYMCHVHVMYDDLDKGTHLSFATDIVPNALISVYEKR